MSANYNHHHHTTTTTTTTTIHTTIPSVLGHCCLCDRNGIVLEKNSVPEIPKGSDLKDLGGNLA